MDSELTGCSSQFNVGWNERAYDDNSICCAACKIIMRPSIEGSGGIAGGAIRAVLEEAGVKNWSDYIGFYSLR